MSSDSPFKHRNFSPQKIKSDEINNLDKNIGGLKNQSRTGYLREYTNNTSLHGFKYLGEKNISIFHKIWWSITIILSIAACGYLISDLWKKWTQTPVLISFGESYAPNWRIPFPAVTICSPIKSNSSIYGNYKNLGSKNITEDELSEIIAFGLVCGISRKRINMNTNESIIPIIEKIAPKMSRTVIRCSANYAFRCLDMFTKILTEEGLCFTSNMLNAKDIYREDVLQHNYNFINGRENQGWQSDVGYDKNLPIRTYPARGIGNGRKSSIQFYTATQEKDSDRMCSLMYDSFKISFHSPNVIPRVSEHFHWIPENMEVSFAIKPRMMTTSNRLRNYRPEKRLCYFSNEKYLKFFKNYTQENCELECLTNYTMIECGCAAYYMPRHDTTPICSMNLDCVRHASEDIHMLQITSTDVKLTDRDVYSASKKGRKAAMTCDCLPGCTSISYDVEISQTPIITTVKNGKNKTVHTSIEAMTNNLSSINVFFKEPRFITTTRTELYGFIDFLANCGGLLGVCLGFSILSFFEIIYFFTIRLFSRYNSNRVSQE